MRVKTVAAVVSLAFIAGSSQSLAQSIDPDLDCALLDGVNEPADAEITDCAKSLLNRQSLINTSGASGLLLKDSDTYTAGVNFAYQF